MDYFRKALCIWDNRVINIWKPFWDFFLNSFKASSSAELISVCCAKAFYILWFFLTHNLFETTQYALLATGAARFDYGAILPVFLWQKTSMPWKRASPTAIDRPRSSPLNESFIVWTGNVAVVKSIVVLIAIISRIILIVARVTSQLVHVWCQSWHRACERLARHTRYAPKFYMIKAAWKKLKLPKSTPS